MKPTIVADEMFPEGAGFMDLEEVSLAGGSTGLYMDLASNEKHVHADFFNNFEDLYDEDDEFPPLAGPSNVQPQPSASAQQAAQQQPQQSQQQQQQQQQQAQQQSQQPSQSGSSN